MSNSNPGGRSDTAYADAYLAERLQEPEFRAVFDTTAAELAKGLDEPDAKFSPARARNP